MRRLLVLRLSALGDVIHTMPAVAHLRAADPEAAVTWVVEAAYAELVEMVAGVAAVPIRMKKWGGSLLSSRKEIRDALRSIRGAEASIDFQGLVKSAVLGWLSGAPARFGFDAAAIREKPALLFTNRRVCVDTARHVVDQNVELAMGAIGEGSGRSHPSLHWDRFPVNRGLDDFSRNVVLLPGAGKPNKLWPAERFRALARHIGPPALAVWGPGERELAEAIGARVAPPTNLRELAWILANAQLVIGGDTGPLHLAAALGAPVVGLYGPTDPRRNGPYGQLEHCIDHFRSTKLMESITVEQVVNLMEKVTAS